MRDRCKRILEMLAGLGLCDDMRKLCPLEACSHERQTHDAANLCASSTRVQFALVTLKPEDVLCLRKLHWWLVFEQLAVIAASTGRGRSVGASNRP